MTYDIPSKQGDMMRGAGRDAMQHTGQTRCLIFNVSIAQVFVVTPGTSQPGKPMLVPHIPGTCQNTLLPHELGAERYSLFFSYWH